MSHIIPYAGRNHSGPVTQNLLWQDGNIYLMDNHRAALWCWQQKLDLYSQPHSLMHIDRHYDALRAGVHVRKMPNLRTISAANYLADTFQLSSGRIPRFRWDNYLSIYLRVFRKQLRTLRLLTHRDGDRPRFNPMFESEPDELPENVDFWLERGPWIVNIDLDYFFCADAHGGWVQMMTDAYIDETFAGLKKAIDEGHVAVVTLCLTPSGYTPGWTECVRLSKRIFKILGARHPRI
ncbi:UPF0489 family protein [Rhizobium leguminosarum]|uniref:UPF0489 family protein n=1 Tax=Rhizobium leguminosarum TaxID=384 RepID=UPI001C98853F|nr:UPF0489 family protein [Rhizobium leguminosarum]MBY5315450.1 hypothetical protein [Rhizobium leguminosarum]